LLCLTGLSLMAPIRAASEPVEFNIGISVKSLSGVNKLDAEITLKAIAQLISKRTGIDLLISTWVYEDVSDLERDAREGNLHLVSTLSHDFLRIRNSAKLDPVFVAARNQDPYKRFLMLIRRERSDSGLAGLKKGRLLVSVTKNNDLPHIWVDTLVRKTELAGSGRQFFGQIEEMERPSKAVLPVFFEKADACLVLRSSYETIVEMNPQIANQLSILEQSDDVLMSVVCVCKSVTLQEMERIKLEIANLHTHEAGRQLLAVFKVGQHIPFQESHLTSVKALLAEHEKGERE